MAKGCQTCFFKNTFFYVGDIAKVLWAREPHIFGQVLPQSSLVYPNLSSPIYPTLVGNAANFSHTPTIQNAPISLFDPYPYSSYISPQIIQRTSPTRLVVPVLHRQLVPLHVDGCEAIVLSRPPRDEPNIGFQFMEPSPIAGWFIRNIWM